MTSRIEQVIREIQQLKEFYNKTEVLRNKIKAKSDLSSQKSISEKSINFIKETQIRSEGIITIVDRS